MGTEKQQNVHPEVAKNGRRPRWTEEEDNLLIGLLRRGLSKREVVEGYQRKFAAMERPNNGVIARIEQVKRLATPTPTATSSPVTPTPVVKGPPEEGPRPTIQGATASICDTLTPFSPEERKRIITAVPFLVDIEGGQSSNGATAFPKPRAVVAS